MKRHKSPPRPVRLRRFSVNQAPTSARLRKALRLLPLGLPLCAGILCAGVVDALLPGARSQPVMVIGAADGAPTTGGSLRSPAERPAVRPALRVGEPVLEATPPAAPVTVVPRAPTSARALPARTTRDAALEQQIERMLVDGRTPYGAVVVMDARSGRVLALAEHSTRGPSDGLALRPIAPAASVFKVVTSAALLEAGVSPTDEICSRGGRTRMTERLLKDHAGDTCITFGDVLPKSANVAVAKLASRRLTPATLRTEAARWGFGARFADIPGLQPSTAAIPDERFPFAEAAAGFGDVKISALHGAVIASIVANDGVLVAPRIDTEVEPTAPTRVIATHHARALRRMMADTVADGTARRAFAARPRLPISAAGKTGSLTDYDTGLDTSWFVGFAPAEAPELVVAALVVNTAQWHIKAPWLAKESLRAALADHGPARAGARVAAR